MMDEDCIMTIKKLAPEPLSCMLALEDETLLVGCKDGLIHYWTDNLRRLHRSFRGHDENQKITALCILDRHQRTLRLRKQQREHDRRPRPKGQERDAVAAAFEEFFGGDGRGDEELVVDFFSSSMDGTVKRWNLFTGECMTTFEDHATVGITSMVLIDRSNYNNDQKNSRTSTSGNNNLGDRLVTGADDGIIKWWSLDDGKCFHTLDGLEQEEEVGEIGALCEIRSRQCVVSGTEGGTLSSWWEDSSGAIRLGERLVLSKISSMILLSYFDGDSKALKEFLVVADDIQLTLFEIDHSSHNNPSDHEKAQIHVLKWVTKIRLWCSPLLLRLRDGYSFMAIDTIGKVRRYSLIRGDDDKKGGKGDSDSDSDDDSDSESFGSIVRKTKKYDIHQDISCVAQLSDGTIAMGVEKYGCLIHRVPSLVMLCSFLLVSTLRFDQFWYICSSLPEELQPRLRRWRESYLYDDLMDFVDPNHAPLDVIDKTNEYLMWLNEGRDDGNSGFRGNEL